MIDVALGYFDFGQGRYHRPHQVSPTNPRTTMVESRLQGVLPGADISTMVVQRISITVIITVAVMAKWGGASPYITRGRGGWLGLTPWTTCTSYPLPACPGAHCNGSFFPVVGTTDFEPIQT